MSPIFMELASIWEPGSYRPAGPFWNTRQGFGTFPLDFGRYYGVARGVWHVSPEWSRGNREARPGLK